MAQASKATTDHTEIQKWAERHGGQPASVKGTGRGDDPGILRIDFPGYSGAGSLEPIPWDEFFRWFDENELALVYRADDRFNKLVSRSTAASKGRSRRSGTRTANGAGKKSAARADADGETKRPKRTATKRTATKRTATKRTATKRTATKRAAAKRPAAKRAPAKRAEAKKPQRPTAAKRATTPKRAEAPPKRSSGRQQPQRKRRAASGR